MVRNLKLCNLFFKETDKISLIKLVDLRYATHDNLYTITNPNCGTPGYMAPEVINFDPELSENYDCQCDIFNLGLIFHVLLIGKSIFIKGNKQIVVF